MSSKSEDKEAVARKLSRVGLKAFFLKLLHRVIKFLDVF